MSEHTVTPEIVDVNFAELFPVPDGAGIFCVDARQLHDTLEVGRDFSNWIKGRIEKYDFIEGVDFEKSSQLQSNRVFAKSGENPIQSCHNDPIMPESCGRPSMEYMLTLDMAKQLCMVENNKIGLLARRYFIACEERLHAKAHIEEKPTLRDLLEFTQMILEAKRCAPNQVAIGMNNVVIRKTGENPLQLSGETLVAPVQKQRLNPTELGRRLANPWSARRVNDWLCVNKYQTRFVDGKKIRYEITEKGTPYGEMIEESYSNGKGTALSPRWYTSLIEVIDNAEN